MEASSELDSLLDVNDKQATNDSLDDLLNNAEEDVEFRPKPNKKPKRIKSSRKSAKLPETVKSKAVQGSTSKMDRSEAVAVVVQDQAGSLSKSDDLTKVIFEHSVSNNSKLPHFERSNTIHETAIQEIGEGHVNSISKTCDKIEQNNVQDAILPLNINNVEMNDKQDIDNKQANKEDDTILDITVDHVKDDSLDDLLNPDENDSVLRPQKSKKPKRIKSFRKSIKGSKDEINKAMASIEEKYKTTNKDKKVEKCQSNSSQDETKTNVSSLPENDLLKKVEHKEKSDTDCLETVAASKISDELSSNNVKQVENVNADMLEIKSTSKEIEPKSNTSDDQERGCNNTSSYIGDETVDTKESKIHESKSLTQGNLSSVEKNPDPSVGESEFEIEERELEDMLKENNEIALEDSLDDILKPTEDYVVIKKQSIKPKRIKSFRKSLKAPIKSKEKLSGIGDTKSIKMESRECDNQIAMLDTNESAKEEYAEECFRHESSPTEPGKPTEIQQESLFGEKATVLPEVPLGNTSNKTFNDTSNANENDIEKQKDAVSCKEKPVDSLTTSEGHAPNGVDHDLSKDISALESKSHEKPFDAELTPERVKESHIKGKVAIIDEIVKPKLPKRVKSFRKSKVFVDDDYDPFAPEAQKSITNMEGTNDVDQSLDFILDAQPIDAALESNFLDKLTDSSYTEFLSGKEAPSEVEVTLEEKIVIGDKESANAVKPKTIKRPKRVKSIRKSKIFIDEDYDPFASNVHSNDDVDTSLDSLLDVQPRGDVPEIDHLMSLDTTTEGMSTFDSSHSRQVNVESSEENVDLNLLADTVTKRTNGPEVANDVTDSSIQMSERPDNEKEDEETNMGNEELAYKECSEINLAHNLSRRDEESEARHEIKLNQDEGHIIEINENSFDDLDRTLIDQPKESSALFGDPDEANAEDGEDAGVFLTISPGNGETNNILTDAILDKMEEESPPETTDPIEDIFDGPDVLDRGHDNKTIDKEVEEVEDTPVRVKQGKAKLKKSMERSFEDLLHGLSDESEPELDEMILSDDNDNTNLESILVSPDQTRSMKPDKDKFSTPARNASTTDSMDILTSTPNIETNTENEAEPRAPPIEVKIDAPDDSEEEDDDKAWEMADKEDKDDQDKFEFADEDEDVDDIVMRNQNKNSNTDSDDDKGIDLSAIEDANHLDVDITKHKSALGKKGSMALRRKQSRKSRRSVMATGEDAIFVDSTVPKPTDLLNGNDDYSDQEAEDDMSPPAKKPSPSVMVPLPGLSGKPPSQRLSASAPDDIDNEAQKPAKRISKPPPGAFKLPDVMPRLGSKSSQSPIEPTKKEQSSTSSHTFEKPQLRSAKPSTVQDSSKETEKGFETPVLRSVGGKGMDKTSVAEERDVTFEKPMLRSTPKSRETTPETNMEIETGTFTKPALKETPRKAQYDKKVSQDTANENIIPRNLRSTNRPNIGQKPSVEKHTFDKPKLKTTGRTEIVDKNGEQDKNENSYTFDKPVLRSARKESQSNDTSESSVSHTFEKPVLKNTGLRSMDDKKDSSNVGKFDKPYLRKTPSPEKEVKPLHEPKGTFDKPSLRKLDNSQSVTDTGSKSDYKTSFPEMKLRKTSSPQKEVVSDKPLWLKDAADKQSKVLDVLQAKENTSISANKDVPSWLDKTPKASRGQPLQDASNSQSELPGERKPSFTQRSRESSIGSENDPEKSKASSSELKAPQNNYVPSWMRQGRSPSVVSPAITTPNSTGSDEIPQWKKDLAQRRASRKEQSPIMDTPQREMSSEPEWKKNIQLRKTRPGDTPAKDKKSVEPEWKKAAEEKRARLRNSAVEN